MDCCAHSHGSELGLMLRFLRQIAQVAWRALTFSYSDTVTAAFFSLTFLWVLVLKKGTPISASQEQPSVNFRRAA